MNDAIQKWSSKRNLQIILLIIQFAVFGGTLNNQYALDDHFVTTAENQQIQKGVKGIKEILTTPYTSIGKSEYGYRPVSEITFAIEYQFFGLNPFLSHLVNLILYYIFLLLLWRLLRVIFSELSRLSIFAIVLIMALHPLHVEVVASLKNREEILAAIFGLGMFLYFITYFKQKRKVYILLALLSFALGFHSKATIYPYIFIVPITLVYFNRINWKKGIALYFGLMILGFAMGVIPNFIFESGRLRAFDFIETPLYNSGLIDRFPTAVYTLIYYVKLILLPYPLLSYYGSTYMEMIQWSDPQFIVATLALLSLLALLFWGIKAKKKWAFGLLLYFIFIGPYANLIVLVPGVVAERYAFLGILGLILFIYYLIEPLVSKINGKKKTAIIIIPFLLILATYAVIDHRRIKDWYDLETLLANDVKKAPSSIKLNTAYGELLQIKLGGAQTEVERETIYKQAESYYKTAIRLYPENIGTYRNLGVLYIGAQEFTKAQNALEKCITLGDTSSALYFNYGAFHEIMGNHGPAIEWYQKVKQDDIEYAQAKERLDGLLH